MRRGWLYGGGVVGGCAGLRFGDGTCGVWRRLELCCSARGVLLELSLPQLMLLLMVQVVLMHDGG